MTTTRDLHRHTDSIGHRLAAELANPRRARRIRTKRPAPYRRGREKGEIVRRPVTHRPDPRVQATLRQLRQSEWGRRLIHLADERAKARSGEILTGLALDTAQELAELARGRHLWALEAGDHAKSISAGAGVLEAEGKLRRCQREHAVYQQERERVEAEIAYLADLERRAGPGRA